MHKLFCLLRQDEGQTMTQYATTLSVITVFCLSAFGLGGRGRLPHLTEGSRRRPGSPIWRSDKYP